MPSITQKGMFSFFVHDILKLIPFNDAVLFCFKRVGKVSRMYE
jgi:hypothetical protein